MSRESHAHPGDRRKRLWLTAALVVATIAAETAVLRKRGYDVGLHAIVRCRDGHLFTTIWIPGASLKAVRLGTLRLQYCPVGRHLTAVRLVRRVELTDETRALARSTHDMPIP